MGKGLEFLWEENVVGSTEFTIKCTRIGDLYINGKFYRQLCFTPNQVALAIEDFLNGVPADDGK